MLQTPLGCWAHPLNSQSPKAKYFCRSRRPLKQLTGSRKPLNSGMTRRKELLFNRKAIHNSMPHRTMCSYLYARYSSQHTPQDLNMNTAQCSFKLEQLFSQVVPPGWEPNPERIPGLISSITSLTRSRRIQNCSQLKMYFLNTKAAQRRRLYIFIHLS